MLEQLPIPLRALLRRPTRARALPFDDPESAGLHASMAIRPEDMGQMVQALAPLVLRFPRGTLQGAERAVCRRNAAPGMGAVLHEYAAALGGFGQWLEGPRRPGAVPWPPLDRNQVRLLAHRLARLDNLRLATAEALHQAIDVRLVLGALQWYMLRAVLRAVVARLSDPACPVAEQLSLKDKFSKLLLAKDRYLAERDDTRQMNEQRRQELEAEARRVEQETLVRDTMAAIRQGRPVDRQTLEEAARAWAAMKKGTP